MSTITLEEWAARLHAAAGGKIREAIRAELVAVALEAEGRAKENATTSPRVRSGTLRRSIAGEVAPTPDGLVLTLSAGGRTGGENLAYARLQELGGVVRPKARKWLTIPMPAAQTTAGVARGGARAFPGLRFQPGRDQTTAWLVRDVGKRRSELMFKLVRRVEIKPKRYLARAWEQVPPAVVELLADVPRKVLP